jgi:hypothetical protein
MLGQKKASLTKLEMQKSPNLNKSKRFIFFLNIVISLKGKEYAGL